MAKIEDRLAVDALLAVLRDRDLEVVARVYLFFIEVGIPGTDTVLIDALNTYGDKRMAEDFLNCDNSRLEEAARGWPHRHNYSILTFGGVSRAKWGSRQRDKRET